MTTHRIAALLAATILTAASLSAQPVAADQFADSVAEYGLLQYLQRFPEPRRQLAQYEQTVGWQAFASYYDALLAKAEARCQARRLFTDVPMARVYLGWRRGTLGAAEAQAAMQRQLDQCLELCTAESAAYQTMCRLMVDFLCRTGQYAAAKRLHEAGRDWCHHSQQRQYEWLRQRWTDEEVPVSLGTNDALRAYSCHRYTMSDWMRRRTPKVYVHSVVFDSLRVSYKERFDLLPRLAPLTLPALLPLPADEPRLDVYYAYYDVLTQLPLPQDGRRYVVERMAYDVGKLFSQSGDSLEYLPALAAVCHRAAVAGSRVSPPPTARSEREEPVMELWRMAMVSERRAYGVPSALAMLAYAECWASKGYPLNVHPLCREAVAVMRRELAAERPDARTLALQQADRQWLQQGLPRLEALVGSLPAYRDVLQSLGELRSALP